MHVLSVETERQDGFECRCWRLTAKAPQIKNQCV